MPIISDPLPPKDKYQQLYQLLKEEYHRILDELRQARATIENYNLELRKRTKELHQANRYIGYLQNKLDAKTLSEGPEVFSTKADSDTVTLSISEVGQKVTALNEEVFQAAATLGEALIHKRHEISQTELDAAAAVSREMVGEKMTNILITQSQKPEPEVNPLLVQVVLQMFTAKFCFSYIRSWYPGDLAIGEVLSAIYREIRSNRGQAVSDRWRALTRAHTNHCTDSETWKKELYRKLNSVLMIASWGIRSAENGESYGHRLPSIIKATNELRMAFCKKVTSADLDIFGCRCDRIYNPVDMDDAYSDGRQSSGERAPEPIVGTTGIGLGEVTAKVEHDNAPKDVLQVIIPAKIVLWSTLNEALEPIKSTTRRKKKLPENTDGANQDGRD